MPVHSSCGDTLLSLSGSSNLLSALASGHRADPRPRAHTPRVLRPRVLQAKTQPSVGEDRCRWWESPPHPRKAAWSLSIPESWRALSYPTIKEPPFPWPSPVPQALLNDAPPSAQLENSSVSDAGNLVLEEKNHNKLNVGRLSRSVLKRPVIWLAARVSALSVFVELPTLKAPHTAAPPTSPPAAQQPSLGQSALYLSCP